MAYPEVGFVLHRLHPKPLYHLSVMGVAYHIPSKISKSATKFHEQTFFLFQEVFHKYILCTCKNNKAETIWSPSLVGSYDSAIKNC